MGVVVGPLSSTSQVTHDPAEAELQKIADGGSARVRVRPEQLMQRVKKPVVKAQNKRDRSAGYAGDAVGQRHTQTVKCRKQERPSRKPLRPTAAFYSVYHLLQKKYRAAAPVEAALHRLVQGESARIS